MNVTQLILDTNGYNIILPESKKGAYTAARQALSVEVEMVTGRMVRELRGNVWVITYQYGFFDDETKNKVIAACEKGKTQAITCGFLPPESTEALSYSDFLVTSFTYPKFMWSRQSIGIDGEFVPVPLWADFSLKLREVKPSD